eukprot:TRINITY_DN109056_c0_g1_i1.p1 TRINITY_DN109056_c0_g1~~TRINITY_DN109056_c0_g1_i1.p1  ORF type:complete len:269 (-),score=56.14 TRINITY_DN109056_c0_g1_i1:41-847(-)
MVFALERSVPSPKTCSQSCLKAVEVQPCVQAFPDEKAPSPWYLVFLHERSFKEEFQEKRRLLAAIVREKQGKLTCFKNAASFEEWVQSSTTPYVLIVGWREAKPSAHTIAQRPPLTTFVLAEQERSRSRAKAWAAQNGAISFSSLDSIADSLSEAVDSQLSLKKPTELAAMQTSQSPAGGEPTFRLHLADVLRPSLPACTDCVNLPSPMPDEASPGPLSLGEVTDKKDAMVTPKDTLGIFGILNELSSYDRREVETMLRLAMPSSYEE